ncbi:hypothetical protein ABB26_03640 [Stenotrophomonas humi]|uniref:Uncharacterized protein n=1 Tax=Stenotrophomonas humi TaxID=405444 RepID=A0A0R0C7L4_9GAMM|nr:hypothetical protein [Stenotrophomonas humi]KRG65645.1 hypothetical protein ABB26_03640 [Stenotrophomonas humi]
MSDQSPPVPPSLLKLERLRIRSDLHFAAKRALSERRKELNDQRKYIRQEMVTAAESFSGSQPTVGIGRPTSLGGKTLDGQRRETLAKLQRWMAAIDAVDAVVAAAYDELSASSGDAGAYQAAAEHLQQTVADWGLSQ